MINDLQKKLPRTSFFSRITDSIFSVNFGFLFILLYVSFINIFVIKATPEIILLQFALLVIIFRRLRMKKFFITWIPFIATFVLYEFLRSYADNFSPFYNITLYWVFWIEKTIFGTLPTITLQQMIPAAHWLTQLSLFFYSIFFYYSFLIAFTIWLVDQDKFPTYFRQFLFLTYISLAVFFLIPTAPPWLAADKFGLGVDRYLMENNILRAFPSINIYYYFVYGNPVAALPSLHTAWPLFSTLFLIKHYKKPALYLLLVIPMMIAFSVILTGEHYIIDLVASVLVVLGSLNIKRIAPKLKHANS